MPKAQVPADELETLIVQAVRRHRLCEDFKSISLHVSKDIDGINWSTGAAEYGHAPPEVCKDALRSILARMQRDYDLREGEIDGK